MLTNTDKEDRHVGCVDETDKRADHVANSVTFGNDESVERANRTEGRVEVACLGNGVSANEGLEDLLVSGKGGEKLE